MAHNLVVPGARTWVEISQDAVAANLAGLRSLLQPETTFCAVLKANAYGHDLKVMAKLCGVHGVSTFAVDTLDEAITIHEVVPNSTILILGFTVPERLRDVVSRGFIQTIYDEETVAELGQVAKETQRVARVTVKAETGLNRQGLGSRGLETILDALMHYSHEIKLEGFSSHFANAEDPGNPNNQVQINAFMAALDRVREKGFDPAYIHIACSAAALLAPTTHFTLVRFGIALYGLWASMETRRTVVLGRNPIDLHPVLSWRTRIAQIKDVASGQRVGYAGTYITNRPMRVAILPVGYYDGYDRRLSNKGEVLVRGRKCSVLGIVCMNMIMIDVSAVPNVKAGDIATLIGRDGMHVITADDFATTTGTIHYEAVTRINPLLPRIIT